MAFQGIAGRVSGFAERLRDAWRYGREAPQDRVFKPHPFLDRYHAYVSDALTFPKLKAMIRAGDSGDLGTMLALYEEMEAKDLHMQGVAGTRRSALTGLDWEIVDATEMQPRYRFADPKVDKTLAREAASFVEEKLTGLDGFEPALEHLTTAIGPNIAVVELHWQRNDLFDLIPIPSTRLTMDPLDLEHVRIITAENRKGIVADPRKFVVYMPHARAGFPFSCTISRAQAPLYLIKLLGIADWGKYVSIFGMPARWAQYKHGASPEEKAEALEMLQKMSAASYALFSEAVSMNLIESSQRGTAPHKDLIDWVERKQSIGWLGQTLTTDTSGTTGTYASASVHDNVRQDLLEDDVRRERRMVRNGIIRPLLAYQFPGRDVPMPYFRRRFRENVDRKVEAETIEVAQRAGVKVPKAWAHDRVGIPVPETNEEVLEPSLDAFGASLTEGFGGA